MASLEAQRKFLPLAIAAARRVGSAEYPAYAVMLVAQAILESDWGTRVAAPFNFFGIKASASVPHTVRDTSEYLNGKWVRVKDRFRSFASFDAGFQYHRWLILTRPQYSAALKHPRDVDAFVRAVGRVYATDPRYPEKVLAIIKQQRLAETFGLGPSAPAPAPRDATAVQLPRVAVTGTLPQLELPPARLPNVTVTAPRVQLRTPDAGELRQVPPAPVSSSRAVAAAAIAAIVAAAIAILRGG